MINYAAQAGTIKLIRVMYSLRNFAFELFTLINVSFFEELTHQLLGEFNKRYCHNMHLFIAKPKGECTIDKRRYHLSMFEIMMHFMSTCCINSQVMYEVFIAAYFHIKN